MGRKAPHGNVAAALKEAPPTEATEWLNFSHPCRGSNRIVDAEAGRVELNMPGSREPRRKFAIVGFASSTRCMAPLDDPEYAVIGMNQLQRQLRHVVCTEPGVAKKDAKGEPVTALRHADLWFEIHKEWNTAVVPGTDHEKWLQDCGIPCFMTECFKELPHSVRYPVGRLSEKFEIEYFTSTIAYMFAWVIDHIDQLVGKRLHEIASEGETALDVLKLIRTLYGEYTIGVFGIDLVVGEEYVAERPCAEFWLGQAMARNISLRIPHQSALLKQHYLYGYQMEADGFITESDLDARTQGLAQEHRAASEVSIGMWGALGELERWPQDEEALKARLAELTHQHQEASAKAVSLHGQILEAQYWAGFRRLRERGATLE